MGHPVDECLVAGFAMPFILTHIVVSILTPQQIDVSSSIPVFTCERHTRTGMGLQQGCINEIIGIYNALSQSAGHFAIIHGIDNLLGIILAFLPSVATDIIDEANARERTVHLIIYAVGDGPAGFAEHDILLSDAPVAHQRTYQRQCCIGR